MKSFNEFVMKKESSQEEFYKVGQLWETSYGVAKVKSVNAAGTATLIIIKTSPQADKVGWKKGETFMAHPDDQTSPSPRTWKLIS